MLSLIFGIVGIFLIVVGVIYDETGAYALMGCGMVAMVIFIGLLRIFGEPTPEPTEPVSKQISKAAEKHKVKPVFKYICNIPPKIDIDKVETSYSHQQKIYDRSFLHLK